MVLFFELVNTRVKCEISVLLAKNYKKLFYGLKIERNKHTHVLLLCKKNDIGSMKIGGLRKIMSDGISIKDLVYFGTKS